MAQARSQPSEVGSRAPTPPLQWQTLLDALPAAAIVVDREQIVIRANQQAGALFPGVREGRTIALASRLLVAPLTRTLQTGERETVAFQLNVPLERHFEASLVPLPTPAADAAGSPAALLVVTDKSEAERLAQMRADFIAHASHELRTPLASVRGFIETLQGPARDDPAARERFLGIMSAEAQRMNRLLDDLLSLARIEMRAHIPPTGNLDLREPLEAVAAMMTPLAAERSVRLVIEKPATPVLARADRDEIVQVISNLVQNAIKYGRDGGLVRVTLGETTAAERRLVRLVVADDGPGIPAQHLPRLTERFYRVDDRASRQKGGTGLGLAIVKHILNRHDGELTIRSSLGQGSTFTVDLPRAPEK
jgi:two-component system phosphate regulon sensor histidine kinase PhoR